MQFYPLYIHRVGGIAPDPPTRWRSAGRDRIV